MTGVGAGAEVNQGEFREAVRDEDATIREVIAESFPDNPKRRPEITAWQYWGNPFGPARVWVYEDGGRIVAVYTGVPVPVRIGGRPGLAGLGVDAAVAPSHRGRRLFTPLSRGLYDCLGRHGLDYTLAYPNASSHKGITRAGWNELAQLRVNVLPLSPGWVADRFGVPAAAARAAIGVGFRTARRSTCQRCPGVPCGVDELWDRWASATPRESGIVRDSAWWGWRYGEHPDQPYRYYETRTGSRLSAAAVTRTVEAFGGRFAYVLELLASEEPAARDLVGGLAAAESGGGAHGVALVAVAGSRLDRLARAAGLRRLPRKLEPYPLYFGAAANRPDVADPTSLNWSVAWGDLDHL